MKTGSILAMALFLVGPAWGSDKHGGQEVEAGNYHVELVVKDKELSLYIRDKGDKPIDPKQTKASASVLSGKDKATVEFAPAGSDRMTAQAPFAAGKDAKVVVTFSVGGAKSEQDLPRDFRTIQNWRTA